MPDNADAPKARAPIQISGAGPAGLAAAIAVAAAGRRAVVYERAHDVAHRFHGDYQGLENWTTEGDVLDELGEMGIAASFEYTAFRETTVFGPDGRPHVYRSEKPFYYVVRRGADDGALDGALKAQALARGVELRLGERAPDAPDGGIVASGPHGANVISVGLVFDTDAADSAYGALSDHLAPSGYAYLLIARGKGTVASCMFADFPSEHTYLDRTVEFFRQRVGFTMRDPHRFGGAGCFAVPHSARRGNALVAGEAGGFQDPLWGFGLRFAMVSGGLAARALVGERPETYDDLWRARLGGILRAGLVNRYAYECLGAFGYRLLLRQLDRAADPRAWLRHLARSRLSRAMYPLVSRVRRDVGKSATRDPVMP